MGRGVSSITERRALFFLVAADFYEVLKGELGYYSSRIADCETC
jgi:hypothetical protein